MLSKQLLLFLFFSLRIAQLFLRAEVCAGPWPHFSCVLAQVPDVAALEAALIHANPNVAQHTWALNSVPGLGLPESCARCHACALLYVM